MANNNVLLLTVHNDKALGVRYIANYLRENNFNPIIVFIKSNTYNPEPITNQDLDLLEKILRQDDYLFIGISILSSFTLSDAKKVSDFIKERCSLPIVWGGAYVTIMPQKSVQYCDIAVRGEGEIPTLELAKAIQQGKDISNIPGICYYDDNNVYIENELAPLIQNIDTIGYLPVGYDNIYLIDRNKIIKQDPLLDTEFYEISCSRGCPFRCSYCCSQNVKRLYKGKGKYLRFRSVDNVIAELKNAVDNNSNIKEIRFWDEIFSNENGWVNEFSAKYKQEIGIPFTIWGHPLMVKEDVIAALSSAGLKRIVVGIQSGSPNVRNNIFKRPESNEQIIKASKILSLHKIPEVYYDLMISHPLETMKEIKETFELCLQLEPPFRLEIHGLAFLPGAEIINIALKQGVCTLEEIENSFNLSFKENDTLFRGASMGYFGNEQKKKVWTDLIYLSQFENIRPEVIRLSESPYKNEVKIRKLKTVLENLPFEEQKSYVIKISILNKIKNIFKKAF